MSAPTEATFDLSGKVAVVTGASRGIGFHIAEALASCGAHVVTTSRRRESAEHAAHRLAEQGHSAFGLAAHMGESAAIAELVETTVKTFGGIDIVVNNAATNPVYGGLLETDAAVFDKIIAVNLRGPLELAKRAHPSMAARGGGAIVNISSVGGLRPEPGLGLYSMSKAALVNLTQTMAREWGRDGIRANVICPGLIQTDFSAALWQNEAALASVRQRLALDRIGQPGEIAALAVFLASSAAGYCTGAVFTVDGGLTI